MVNENLLILVTKGIKGKWHRGLEYTLDPKMTKDLSLITSHKQSFKKMRIYLKGGILRRTMLSFCLMQKGICGYRLRSSKSSSVSLHRC